MPLTDPFHSSDGNSRARRLIACVSLLIFCAWPALSQQKALAIYAPQMYYQVAVTDHGGTDYVGLIDLLEPLGRVEARIEGKKWRLRFTANGATKEAEFQDGKRSGKIGGNEIKLPVNFLLQGDRGYLPLAALPNLLPRILERTTDLHAGGRRLFIGATAVKLNLQLLHAPNHLVANFSAPVSPQVSTDGSQLRIVFTRDPVVPSSTDQITYTDPPFASVNVSEANGAAILNVVGTAPLQASFSDGGKTLTISAVAPQTPAPSQAPAVSTAQAPPVSSSVPTPAAAAPGVSKPRVRSVVAVDAGHGGDERGAQLTETLNEKDVTLALARRIQHELEARGIAVYMVRNGDTTLTSEQRAAMVNGARPALYVTLHAATLGTGVRIFTAMVPSVPRGGRRAFIRWDNAQAAFAPASAILASAIAGECTARSLPVKSLSAPVRPLNNISAPAVAIEIAPADDTVESISDPRYQQSVASAIAAGIAASRGKLEAQ